MIETFCALLIAHVLADFLFQTRWMVDQKNQTGVMLLHGAIVLATALALLGIAAFPALLALAAVHVGIDLIKTGSNRKDLAAFLLDQAAHIASLLALAALTPHLWAASHLATLPAPWPTGLLHIGMLVTGFLLSTRAGGFAIGMLMASPAWQPPDGGLPDGGRMIGLLERGLIFLLVIAGQFEAIGFLIAAKSILRFGTVGENRAVSEYVIIGTLASFGWAISISLVTAHLLAALPPLVLSPLAP